MSNIVEARALTKTYGSLKALDGINLTIPTGAISGLIGPNGAGKTCLLYTSPSPRDRTRSRMPSSA